MSLYTLSEGRREEIFLCKCANCRFSHIDEDVGDSWCLVKDASCVLIFAELDAERAACADYAEETL